MVGKMDRKTLIFYFLSIFIPVLIIFLCFLFQNNVPQFKDLPKNEQTYLKNLTLNVTKNCKNNICKVEEILIFIRKNVNFYAPKNYSPSNPNYVNDPLLTLKRGYGLCYDLSYLFEMMAQSIGLKTRHLAAGIPGHSHAISEVYIPELKKWIVVDPSYATLYTDCKGNYLSMKELLESKAHCIVNLLNISDVYDLRNFHCFTYGVYSINGKMFSPKIPFPDIEVKQLVYNLNNPYFYPICLITNK
jgi:hypothetical protein